MKTAIINVNLEFNFEDFQTDEEIMDELMNVDLPSNYVEDSFEFVKIIKSEV